MRKIKRRDIGRKFTFTPRNRRLLYAAIRAGLPYNRSCEMVGVPLKSFQYWMERGKTEGPSSAYYQFRAYIRRIEARKEAELLAVIDKVAKGDYKIRETEITFADKGRVFKRKTKIMRPEWKAAAWRLERKYKEDYAPMMPNDSKERSPEEIAEQIHAATQQLRESVPLEDEAA